MLYDVIWCSMTKSAALAIMFHLNQTFLGPNCHSELNFSCPSAILWLDEQMVMFNLNSYLQMVKWSTALWFLLGHGRFNPGAIFTTMCQNLKPHPANKITQSAITKFHLRCQMLQTYKATSIIQRQIPPSIHIIRYQSNSKLINHHQSRGFLTNPISETSPMSHGFALASPWPFFAAQGTKAQQVLDKFCSVKSWICTTASRAMAINTYGHRFDQGYLVGGWPTPLNMSSSVGMMTFQDMEK